MMLLRHILQSAAIVSLLALTACGGTNNPVSNGASSGGGGGGGTGLPVPDPLAAAQPASNFTSTADFDP
jgi:hypothetical protein